MAIHPKALEKAKSRLNIARTAIEQLPQCSSKDEFDQCWYTFLVAWKNVYTTLEQGSKSTAQDRQWFGAKKQERRSDPLLQYLFQARDSDEHGLEDIVELEPGGIFIGGGRPGVPQINHVRVNIDENGNSVIEAQSLNDQPLDIQWRPGKIVLSPVIGRGFVRHDPPAMHLGEAVRNRSPFGVASLGLNYLVALLDEANSRP
ncbi:hypothetical protein [Hyphomonas jannaschiana]|uniref:hypothetical protein n=1 Tax=Hyphomonas jannaschiana TaxID=86 RepID=UPI0035C722D0